MKLIVIRGLQLCRTLLKPICYVDRMLVSAIEKIAVKIEVKNRLKISNHNIDRKSLNVPMIAHACGGG